jgi:tripartite-type tricarboxylate transporter receptor subunit TctC
MDAIGRGARVAPRNLAQRAQLVRRIGIKLGFVPYKGAAPLVTDLVGGQLPAGISLLSDMIRHARSGKVAMLAISGSRRAATAPDVSTFTELGFAAMAGTGWQGFHAPAKTPRPVVERLSTAIATALKAPEVGGAAAAARPRDRGQHARRVRPSRGARSGALGSNRQGVGYRAEE